MIFHHALIRMEYKMGKKDSEAENFKRAASNLMMTDESEREILKPEPKERLFNSEDWYGKTEEEAFEDNPGEVIRVLGTELASQTWSNGSWSNVYEYKGKFFSFDEVSMEEFDNPKDAFDRASIGRDDYDEIDSQWIHPNYQQYK